jgi:hypothetical protein
MGKRIMCILLLIVPFIFMGCKHHEIMYSKVLEEPAVVYDTVYFSGSHGSGIGVGPVVGGEGGIGISVVSVDIEPMWSIIFKCQHGKFVVEGSSERYKALYEALERNDKVTVIYREKLDVLKDGKDILEQHLIGYDFLGVKEVPNLKF